jgi:hypothetical protein
MSRLTERRNTRTYTQFLTEIIVRDYNIREAGGPRESHYCNRGRRRRRKRRRGRRSRRMNPIIALSSKYVFSVAEGKRYFHSNLVQKNNSLIFGSILVPLCCVYAVECLLQSEATLTALVKVLRNPVC